MWIVLLISLSLILIFPRKFLFILRSGYSFYWYPFFFLLIRVWTVKDPQTRWTTHTTWFLGVRLVEISGSVPTPSDRSVMLLGNHRNIGDFVIHDVITKHTANYLSRALVGFAFPFMGIVSYMTGRCWYFVRGQSTKDLDQFYVWLDEKFAWKDNLRKNLIVYPEGHRNLKKDPLPLRTGMLRYAFTRKLPVQIFMCHGYDEVLNEKRFTSNFGNSLVKYKIYPILDPKEFENLEEFIETIKTLFEERFYEVHGRK